MAVIDVGSNTIRVLVGDAGPMPGGKIETVSTGLVPTRLGEGFATGSLSYEAMQRSLLKINEFVALARDNRAERIIITATSAVRDAANKDIFCNMVRENTGIKVTIVSGEEEACYSYLGVNYGLPQGGEKYVVVDVGGGSTELTWFKEGRIHCCSVKVGAVRATEGSYSAAEISTRLAPALEQVGFPHDGIIGVGGTVTSMALMQLGLPRYDPARIHGSRISYEQVVLLYKMLAAKTVQERKNIPGLPADRADIITAGVLIIQCLMSGFHAQTLVVSETGFMHGVLLKQSGQFLSK